MKRRVRRARDRIKQLSIPEANAKAILDFADHCFSEGLSTGRVLKYLYTLKTIATDMTKCFDQVERADIQRFIRGIEQSDYSEWTKRDFRITLKRFFQWLRDSDDYPPEVSWLRSTVRNQRQKLPDQILTQAEVKKLIAAAHNKRDRALIATLYESGCRAGEIRPLRIKQLQRRSHGIQITVHGSKGARRLLLIASVPYLTEWLNSHPDPQNPDAPVWPTTSRKTEYISHARIAHIFRAAAKRAGIKKPVNPHNFRHSRATHLATHLTEAQMKEYFGWVQGSDMASTYVHLSGRDVDNALLRLHNIPVDDNDDQANGFSLRECPTCETENPPTNNFCSRCGGVLDEETAKAQITAQLERSKAQDALNDLLDDEDVRDMLDRKLRERGWAKDKNSKTASGA